ncbi:hypothetical protein [Streptomyces acidiscabies]|uniref:hypothetical protein n=1 Tax=Streptomyces acidiscabies TaxID=42234 RepID=UPI0038F612A5
MKDVGSWWPVLRSVLRRFSVGLGRSMVGVGSLYLALPEVRDALSGVVGARPAEAPPRREPG